MEDSIINLSVSTGLGRIGGGRGLLSTQGFPDSSVGKESACSAGDPGSIPGLGRSPREGDGYPLQYSGLENSMGCIVYGVAKGGLRACRQHTTNFFYLVGVSVSAKQLKRAWLRILSIILKEELKVLDFV